MKNILVPSIIRHSRTFKIIQNIRRDLQLTLGKTDGVVGLRLDEETQSSRSIIARSINGFTGTQSMKRNIWRSTQAFIVRNRSSIQAIG
jgi:hypothetical protein